MNTCDDEQVGVARILAALGDPDLVSALATKLPSSDLTSLLLAVFAQRASRTTAPETLARYKSDRFSRPATVPFLALRRAEDAFIRAVPDNWNWIQPSPLVPLATHHVLGDTSQNRIVTTIRANEVAADPTASLALEAAERRTDTTTRRSADRQRLAAIQRITRAQRYVDEAAFVHFSVFGLVTAGRSMPREGFDSEALVEQLDVYVPALSSFADDIEIVISADSHASGQSLADRVRHHFADVPKVRTDADDKRLAGQHYYTRACFKINVTVGSVAFEMTDGGFTDWTQRLLGDRHERLLISGAGLDRLAEVLADAS